MLQETTFTTQEVWCSSWLEPTNMPRSSGIATLASCPWLLYARLSNGWLGLNIFEIPTFWYSVFWYCGQGRKPSSHGSLWRDSSGHRGPRPMECIHWDTVGAMRSKSIKNQLYATVFVRSYSGYAFLYGHASTADIPFLFLNNLCWFYSASRKTRAYPMCTAGQLVCKRVSNGDGVAHHWEGDSFWNLQSLWAVAEWYW